MKLNYKKSLKLITLLITSLLISFVSAQSYSELFMHGTPISIGTAKVKFVAGANTTTMGGLDAINTAETVVTFDTILAIEPGEIRTYEQAVNITNGATSPKTINISLVSLTGPFSANFEYINITMIDASGTTKGNSIKIVSSGENVTETGGQQIANGATWRIRWIIKAKTSATNGQSINVTFKVKVE
jgi:hypothetical protein